MVRRREVSESMYSRWCINCNKLIRVCSYTNNDTTCLLDCDDNCFPYCIRQGVDLFGKENYPKDRNFK